MFLIYVFGHFYEQNICTLDFTFKHNKEFLVIDRAESEDVLDLGWLNTQGFWVETSVSSDLHKHFKTNV